MPGGDRVLPVLYHPRARERAPVGGIEGDPALGAFQWVPIELPQGEALDLEFYASIMPSQRGEVPRKIYVMPLVASTVQIDALAEVRAN